MKAETQHGRQPTKDAILSMVATQPCSVQRITHAFSARSYEIVKLLSDMVRNGQVTIKSTNERPIVVSNVDINQPAP